MSGVYQRSLSRSVVSSPPLSELGKLAATTDKANPTITILLCTYNGARFIASQLSSIENQCHQNWRLLVSDDGSTDETLGIVRDFARRVPNDVEVRAGPGQGPCANFLSLAADPAVTGDYFSFCDQDDLWHPNKLTRALQWLESVPDGMPAAYGARTRLVDVEGHAIGHSPHFRKETSFANALVQSISGANTMLFNRTAKWLLERGGPVAAVSHDWWVYQLVCGAGGVMRYDSEAHIDYRQHPGNQIGCNRGWRALLQRTWFLLTNGFAKWNETNSAALHQCSNLLTTENRALLDSFDVLREGPLIVRLKTFFNSPLRRQTTFGNAVLLAAILLRKL